MRGLFSASLWRHGQEACLRAWKSWLGLRDLGQPKAWLMTLGGFTCAEIGAMLGTSEGAVMTRLTRARQALRQQHAGSIKRRTGR